MIKVEWKWEMRRGGWGETWDYLPYKIVNISFGVLLRGEATGSEGSKDLDVRLYTHFWSVLLHTYVPHARLVLAALKKYINQILFHRIPYIKKEQSDLEPSS